MIQTVNKTPRPTILPPGWTIREQTYEEPLGGFLRSEVMLSCFDPDANGGNVLIAARSAVCVESPGDLDVSARSDFNHLGIRWKAEASRVNLAANDTEMETRLGNLLRMLPGPYGEAWVKILGPVREYAQAAVLEG